MTRLQNSPNEWPALTTGARLRSHGIVEREIGDEDRRLAVLRLAQLVFGAVALQREQDRSRALRQHDRKRARRGRVGGNVDAHADACEPWPGKTDGDAHQRRPPPRDGAPREAAAEADEDDHVARLHASARTVSESAIGIDAAEVLPYSAMLTTTLSSGRFKYRAAASMMR